MVQPVALSIHNFIVATVLVYHEKLTTSHQAVTILVVMWVYLLYLALAQPFQNDNAIAVISRVIVVGAVAEYPRTVLLYMGLSLFAFVHIWRIFSRLIAHKKVKNAEAKANLLSVVQNN